MKQMRRRCHGRLLADRESELAGAGIDLRLPGPVPIDQAGFDGVAGRVAPGEHEPALGRRHMDVDDVLRIRDGLVALGERSIRVADVEVHTVLPGILALGDDVLAVVRERRGRIGRGRVPRHRSLSISGFRRSSS